MDLSIQNDLDKKWGSDLSDVRNVLHLPRYVAVSYRDQDSALGRLSVSIAVSNTRVIWVARRIRNPQAICSYFRAVYERMVFISCTSGLPTTVETRRSDLVST